MNHLLHFAVQYLSRFVEYMEGGKDSIHAEVQICFNLAQNKETRGSHRGILGCSLCKQFTITSIKSKVALINVQCCSLSVFA